MPHWFRALAKASRPAVKFRFTGTLPASSTPGPLGSHRSSRSGFHGNFIVFAHGLAFYGGIGNLTDHQLDGADSIVVGRDYVIDIAGVTIGIDHADDGDL